MIETKILRGYNVEVPTSCRIGWERFSMEVIAKPRSEGQREVSHEQRKESILCNKGMSKAQTQSMKKQGLKGLYDLPIKTLEFTWDQNIRTTTHYHLKGTVSKEISSHSGSSKN